MMIEMGYEDFSVQDFQLLGNSMHRRIALSTGGTFVYLTECMTSDYGPSPALCKDPVPNYLNPLASQSLAHEA